MWGEGTARLLQEVYLHVVLVLARQLHGQLTLGLGTAIPQPADFRGQLQLLDREVRGEVWDGTGPRSATRGGEREPEREREEGERNETAIGKGDVAVKVKTGREASDREAAAELWSEGRS